MFAKQFCEGGAVPENNQQLADAVADRVRELGMSQAQVSAAGGPSSTTMTKVLSGTGGLRDAIFGQLDRALEWEPGTARSRWRGEAQEAPRTIDWRSATNQELLAEVGRRMEQGGQQWATGTPGPEDDADDGGVVRPFPDPRYDPDMHQAQAADELPERLKAEQRGDDEQQ